jgi:hypothetical protein
MRRLEIRSGDAQTGQRGISQDDHTLTAAPRETVRSFPPCEPPAHTRKDAIMANADTEIEATVIAATLAVHGKISAEDIAKAVKLYRACQEKIVAELKKADLAVGVGPGHR